MDTKTQVRVVRNLVKGFDDENGVPETVYIATCDLINEVFGANAVGDFSNAVKAVDGHYYLPKGRFQDVWPAIIGDDDSGRRHR